MASFGPSGGGNGAGLDASGRAGRALTRGGLAAGFERQGYYGPLRVHHWAAYAGVGGGTGTQIGAGTAMEAQSRWMS